MPNLYCDNYRFCNGYVLDMGDPKATEARARAKGWHLYHGVTTGGNELEGVMCAVCSGSTKRRLSPAADPLPGQEGLFTA
jgi:hypothetical protein